MLYYVYGEGRQARCPLQHIDNLIHFNMKLSEKMRLMLDSMQADLDAMDSLINDAQSIIEREKQAEEKWLEEYSAWAD